MFEERKQYQNIQGSVLIVLEASRNNIISNLAINGIYRCQNYVMQVFFNLEVWSIEFVACNWR